MVKAENWRNFLLLLVGILSFPVHAEVSVEKYNRLVDIANNNYSEGKCSSYGDVAQQSVSYLYNDVPGYKLGNFFDIDTLNRFLIWKTESSSLRSSSTAFSTILDATNILRKAEADATINIGIAKRGIISAEHFIKCSESWDNIEVIKGKKELLEDIITEINQSQLLIEKVMQELMSSYSEDRPYRFVVKEEEGQSEIASFFRQAYSSVTRLDGFQDTNSRKVKYLYSSTEKNDCIINALFKDQQDQYIRLSLDFTKGIGWSSPKKGIMLRLTDTEGNTMIIGGSESDHLHYIGLDDLYLDKTAYFFDQLHNHCYQES